MSDINASENSHLSKVKLLTHVEIELIDPSGEREQLSFDIVADDQADYYAGLLGQSTPLARAILDKRPGDLVRYQADQVYQVRILAVREIEPKDLGEPAARRKEVAQKALRDAERRNALTFATTVDGKWGDYDADGMIENWEGD